MSHDLFALEWGLIENHSWRSEVCFSFFCKIFQTFINQKKKRQKSSLSFYLKNITFKSELACFLSMYITSVSSKKGASGCSIAYFWSVMNGKGLRFIVKFD